MKSPRPSRLMTALRRHTHSFASRGLFLALALGTPPAVHGADSGQTFASPEEAVAALVAAASAHDLDAFRVIFGPASAEIQNPDQVQAANELDLFTAACGQHRQILRVSDARCVLEVGEDHWPFPIPLVQQEGRWFFDTEAGKEELLNRRIGRNEISTLQSVRAYVEAQREYAAKDRDDDEVLEYAPKFISSPGRKDGLHWPPGSDGEISPLGPLVAQAQHQGYAMRARNPGDAPEPFHGYFFRILIRQAASAPGGRYDYVINGNMIGGFALVAWPAEYGESGIMTFVVNQQGRVYQKDLGPGTEKSVRRLKAYAPDQTWVVSPD